MSNKPHMRVTDKRHARTPANYERPGLVEITVSDDGQVWLELLPVGKDAVQLPMLPADARALAQGLLEGAEEAERGADT